MYHDIPFNNNGGVYCFRSSIINNIRKCCLGTWQNDIALVKLREAVPVSEELLPEIQSVTLPERNDTLFPADGARCIMVGWGCTARGRPKRKKLVTTSFLHSLWTSDRTL